MGVPPIESIERFDLANADNSRSYRISVFAPALGVDKLPILFITDADCFFGTATELLDLQAASGIMNPAILVGIGYGSDIAGASVRRFAELSTPLSDEGRKDLPLLSAAIGPDTGGAAAFRDFIIDTLTPEVARRYTAADPSRCILFGTSLGGLMAAYTLFTRPHAFEGFVIGSPSLFWDRFAVLKVASELAMAMPLLGRKPKVFIGVGGAEEDVPEVVPAGLNVTLDEFRAALGRIRMIGAARELAYGLRDIGLPMVKFRIFEGEGHQQAVFSQLNHGLRYVLS